MHILRADEPVPEVYLNGNVTVAGVDEAGRGPLAGSVVAAAVVLDRNRPIDGLADSKKLSASRREQLELEIMDKALSWAVASVSSVRIDEVNILNATMEAMRMAYSKLSVCPDTILIDGNRTPENSASVIAVIKGDQRVNCISAASILAKVERDRQMMKLHDLFPDYGFASHKGYPTKLHLDALNKYGPLDQHRKSYAPVQKMLERTACTSR